MAVITWEDPTKIIERSADVPRVDPYYEWARTTEFEYYDHNVEWLPVLIELREGSGTAKDFANFVYRAQKAHEPWAADLRVPGFYREPIAHLQDAHLQDKPMRFLAMLTRKKFLSDVSDGKRLAKWIKRFELGRATPTSDVEKARTATASQSQKKAKVAPKLVIGVVDDGIAFAHDRFWSDDDKTRIEYFWDQLKPSFWGYLGFGTQFSRGDIATRMGNSRYGSLVDEDEVYRLSGHADHTKYGHKPLASRATHGTHVMDLACSFPTRPTPGKLPIVAVQLPVATVEDTSGAKLGPQVFNGLFYILVKANAIGSVPLPVVANVSYGMIAGPHDGESLLEVAMDQLVELCDPPLRVVLPAGNNHLSRCHANFDLKSDESRTLHWRVLPDDWTESQLEIWLPSSNGPPVNITITAPDGKISSSISPGNQQLLLVGSQIVGQVSYYPFGYAGTRAVLLLSLAPTGSPSAGVPLSPAGLWQVQLTNDSIGAVKLRDIHAWIQRDDTAPGYKRRGRQSYFDDPAYRRYDDGGRPIEVDNASCVKRKHTLNAIATGQKTIVIGGFRRSDWKATPDSARGPAIPPGRSGGLGRGPDAMWPSDEAPSHRGVLGAGTRSGSCVAMNGTSVAAPQAARWIANQWLTVAAPSTVDRNAVFNFAGADTRPDKPPLERGGGGRVSVRPERRKRRRED